MDLDPIKHENTGEKNKVELSKDFNNDAQAIKDSENEALFKEKEMDMAIPSEKNSDLVKLEIEVLEEDDADASQSPAEQIRESITIIEKNERQKQSRHNVTFSKPAWDRWNDLKTSLSVKTHSALAILLIDCWFERHSNSGHEQRTIVTASNAVDTIKFESEDIKVEINDEDSNESTDVDYEELSSFMKARKENENDVCPVDSKQMESGDSVTGLMSDCSTRNMCTHGSERKREGRKRKVSDDQDYSSHGDSDGETVPSKSKKNSSLKNRKNCKEKKSKVIGKEKKLKVITKNVKKNKSKVLEPKTPWIKIQLFEHEDKYQVESMKSFARMNRSNDAVETLFSCLVCNQFKCASRDIFENHIEKHVNKVLDCEGCQYIGNSEQDIREHKWRCCKRPKRESVCPLCGHWTASSESRRHHLGKVHGIPSWKCIFCPDMFKTRDERKDHMRTAHEEASQYCDSCKLFKYTLSKEDFKGHLENCSSSMQCQICGLLVKTKSMNQHIQSKHENIRKHQCHRCPYAAKTVRRLKTHLLSHDNIHPFKCNLCPFTCIQSNQLKSHMRTHTGEKPYKCTQCKYAAAWNVQLKDHIKVHSITTAVMCQECDVAFKNDRTLNLHMKKEHCQAI